MPRHSVTITEKFRAAVEAYRRQRGLPSWSSAIVELAAIALGYQEQAVGSWGGDRKTVIPDPDAQPAAAPTGIGEQGGGNEVRAV